MVLLLGSTSRSVHGSRPAWPTNKDECSAECGEADEETGAGHEVVVADHFGKPTPDVVHDPDLDEGSHHWPMKKVWVAPPPHGTCACSSIPSPYRIQVNGLEQRAELCELQLAIGGRGSRPQVDDPPWRASDYEVLAR